MKSLLVILFLLWAVGVAFIWDLENQKDMLTSKLTKTAIELSKCRGEHENY